MSTHDPIKQALSNALPWHALVIGDVMVDEYDFCYSTQSKEIPSEKKGKRAFQSVKRLVAPGGAANTAVNLTRLSAITTLIGITGVDGYETVLRRECEAASLRTILLGDRNRITTLKRRIYVDDEYFFRIDNEQFAPATPQLTRQLIETVKQRCDENQVIVVSDYNKGIISQELAQEVVDQTNYRNIPLIVDCKPVNVPFFKGAHTLVINLPEAQVLVPEFVVNENLSEHLQKLYSVVKTKRLVVTLGARGMCGFDGKLFYREMGIPVVAKDAVGAGDTVRAGLALGAAKGLSLPHSMVVANICGALVVQQSGTSSISLADIIAFLE